MKQKSVFPRLKPAAPGLAASAAQKKVSAAPIAPPVYRPTAPVPAAVQPRKATGAPPVYRPQGVAQAKIAPMGPPPAYRPQAVSQAKLALRPAAPPVFGAPVRNQTTVAQRKSSNVVQMKCAYCGEGGHSEKHCPYAKDDGPVAVEAPQKKSAPRAPRPKAKKGIPTELVWDAPPVAPTLVRPAVGTTLLDLQNMNGVKNNFPSTFAATMAAVGGYTVTDMGTLTHGGGTAKETHEWKISLSGMSFVVHYHPNVVIPQGAQNGESKVHVKGDRSTKHHENMTDSFLTTLGITV